MKVVCVIPFFNEYKRLNVKELNNIFNVNSDVLFILANDGSTDGTLDILTSFALQHENVRIFSKMKNQGKGEIIRQAILTYEDAYDMIGYFDADLASPFSEFKKLVPVISSGFDAAICSRVYLSGVSIRRKSYRHILSRIIITLINMRLRLGVYDSQCGVKIFSNAAAQEIFKNKFKTSWLFDIELILRLKALNMRIVEKTVDYWADIDGSKFSVKEIFRVGKEIVLLMFSRAPSSVDR